MTAFDQQPTTRAVRAGIATDRHHGAVVPPIHLSSTFAFDGFNGKREYDYTRSGNPTRTLLADALAVLVQGELGVVTSITADIPVLVTTPPAPPSSSASASASCVRVGLPLRV